MGGDHFEIKHILEDLSKIPETVDNIKNILEKYIKMLEKKNTTVNPTPDIIKIWPDEFRDRDVEKNMTNLQNIMRYYSTILKEEWEQNAEKYGSLLGLIRIKQTKLKVKAEKLKEEDKRIRESDKNSSPSTQQLRVTGESKAGNNKKINKKSKKLRKRKSRKSQKRNKRKSSKSR